MIHRRSSSRIRSVGAGISVSAAGVAPSLVVNVMLPVIERTDWNVNVTSPGEWTQDGNPYAGPFSYRWYVDGALRPELNDLTTYIMESGDDAGLPIVCRVIAGEVGEDSNELTLPLWLEFSAAAGAPDMRVGSVVTVDSPTIYGVMATEEYRWTRNGVVISGASGLSYTLTEEDANQPLAIQGRLQDALGQWTPWVSFGVPTPDALSSPSFVGDLQLSSGSTSAPAELYIPNPVASLGNPPPTIDLGSINWFRGGVLVGGATESLIVTEDEVEYTANISITNSQGYADRLTLPIVLHPLSGTFLWQTCVGNDLYDVYADGLGGTYQVLNEENSPTCTMS